MTRGYSETWKPSLWGWYADVQVSWGWQTIEVLWQNIGILPTQCHIFLVVIYNGTIWEHDLIWICWEEHGIEEPSTIYGYSNTILWIHLNQQDGVSSCCSYCRNRSRLNMATHKRIERYDKRRWTKYHPSRTFHFSVCFYYTPELKLPLSGGNSFRTAQSIHPCRRSRRIWLPQWPWTLHPIGPGNTTQRAAS